MGRMLSMPVQKSELIAEMLQRMKIHTLSEHDRTLAVRRVQDIVNIFHNLMPDYLREVNIRMR